MPRLSSNSESHGKGPTVMSASEESIGRGVHSSVHQKSFAEKAKAAQDRCTFPSALRTTHILLRRLRAADGFRNRLSCESPATDGRCTDAAPPATLTTLRCHSMKSVDRKADERSRTMCLRSSLFDSVPFVATTVRMEKTLSASDTERVPSAESFLPVNGNVSGPR